MSKYIPSTKYLNRATMFLFSEEFNINTHNDTYYLINERINDSLKLEKLLRSNGIAIKYKISPGTSERLAFRYYLELISKDLKKHKYRSYTVPKGSLEARRALAFCESLNSTIPFDAENFCLSIGSTGGITLVFDYIKKTAPDKKIIIPVPTYYLYSQTSRYFNLAYKEILCYKKVDNNIASFINIDAIIEKTNKDTSLVVLINPSNPSGEIYSEDALRKIIKDAQKKGYLLLVDELFSDLAFSNFIPIVKIASELNALDKIIIIKGYSKNKNLAGLRLGYVYSKNRKIMDAIQNISEIRNCFPYGEQYTGLIVVDAFIQSVYLLIKNGYSLNSAISIVKKELAFSTYISEKSKAELEILFSAYKKYFNYQLHFYKNEYMRVKSLLKNEIILETPTKAAFNTFFKIRDLDDTNYFDFCFNLYLSTGVYTQIGPAFGLDQKTWQESRELGFWLRITFARDRKMMTEGIKRFIEFKKIYLNNPKKFIRTNLYF